MPSALKKLENAAQSKLFLQELRRQLAKDLAIPLEAVPDYALVNWLSHFLAQAYPTGDAALAQLLYRVDVNENLLGEADELHFDFLAQALLEREAQKVLFRAQHRGDL